MKMDTMNVDYRSINIIGTLRESRTIRTTLELFGTDVTTVATNYGNRAGTVMVTVTINTTDPKRTADAISRHLTYDTIVSPRIFFTE